MKPILLNKAGKTIEILIGFEGRCTDFNYNKDKIVRRCIDTYFKEYYLIRIISMHTFRREKIKRFQCRNWYNYKYRIIAQVGKIEEKYQRNERDYGTERSL